MWAVILTVLSSVAGVYLYLRLSCYFTERSFMLAYRGAMFRSSSHGEALRLFECRAPFNLLSSAELDHACAALAALHEPRIVARIVRLLDRGRDASVLRSEAFLRGVVFTHSWMPR